MTPELTKSEQLLLEWLAKEEFSQYGECNGTALDGLIQKGLAVIHDEGHQESFIAKGKGCFYRAVSLTELGHRARVTASNDDIRSEGKS